jgi:hypothetical protein
VLRGISALSWVIFVLSTAGATVAAWGLDPNTGAGKARIVASILAGVVACLALVNGTRTGRRIAALEAGRYPRVDARAWQRVVSRLVGQTAQTVTIDGEGGDDVREIAAGLRDALQQANWDIRKMTLGAALWGAGRGICVYHTTAAAPAAIALIEGLTSEGLPAVDAGECTSGLPVHIAFRRP